MSERGTSQHMPVERWWPQLSIDAKHRVIAAVEQTSEHGEVELDEVVVAEITELAGGSGAVPERLTWRECDYIRTQIEAVD